MTCFENFINDHYDELLQHSNRYVGKKYGADVLHDMLYAFLTKQDKLDALCERGEMMAYICRAIYIASYSNESFYNRKYKIYDKLRGEYTDNHSEPEETATFSRHEEQLKTVFAILQDIHWFDREVFKAYYLHNHTLDTFTNATGIPRQTLYRSIRKAKKQIKEAIEQVEGTW